MKKIRMTSFILLIVLVASACGETKNNKEVKHPGVKEENAVETSSEKQEEIEATIKDKDGADFGTVTLVESEDGVKLNVEANHLQPGSYGIHIHERGLCEPPSFESAEGHFNPDDRQHGFYQKDGPHKGDMENLKVNEEGEVDQTYLNELVTLEKNATNSLRTKDGTSIIIHENEDDYISQPAGNAGERIYCAVIHPTGEDNRSE